ncbi:hypothetical protein LH452_13080 [Laribacter hongkongensis]|uniref:hypothetical protein n=1 Tax=Laribacter hongkongensis TaxID=168471 RepID=UPI001EFCE5EB|nr:hypothetical protein [Laribacter hongkongensis]MCG9059840.1 hypothetical protein [Laribacter hongkongensis]MCG9084804.1 hypothetical protein [Laribacter hongkongensis]
MFAVSITVNQTWLEDQGIDPEVLASEIQASLGPTKVEVIASRLDEGISFRLFHQANGEDGGILLNGKWQEILRQLDDAWSRVKQ